MELISGFEILAIYFAFVASVALICRKWMNIPDEIFRKTLHLILLTSILIWTVAFETWYVCVLSVILFVVIVYPILWGAEHVKGYSQLVTERSSGELKSSLVIVFLMFAGIMTICWGLLGDKLLGLCCVYAWGYGDGAAALVGKYFGKHKLEGKHIEGKKSVEGSVAMFVVSFVSVVIVLVVRGGMAWWTYFAIALPTALVSTFVELYTKRGLDTITCPVCSMAVILPLVHILGGGLW